MPCDSYERSNITKEKVQFTLEVDNEGEKALVLNNYFADENGRKPRVLKTFHIAADTMLAQKLIRENLLQKNKKFVLNFTKVAHYDEI